MPRIGFNSLDGLNLRRRVLDRIAVDRIALAAAVMLSLAVLRVPAMAQEQKGFPSPEAAANALESAAQNNDETAMLQILGRDAKRIVSSGDEAEDAGSRANFVKKYGEMHRFVKEPDGSVVLYIGAENWPTPIPLVERGHEWYFDSEAGKREILFRRIGRNEISTIRVCQELVAAEKEYYSSNRNEYAGELFSDQGQHNGLYWDAAEGDPQSPIGPLVAAAVSEGYTTGKNGAPQPYRGYYYRVLMAQGKHASGGAKSYIANGKMTQGFAFVAYPAEYRSSGVMTFIVNQDGVVYQKDLGKKTEVVAKTMKEYDPGPGWQKAELADEETAASREAK